MNNKNPASTSSHKDQIRKAQPITTAHNKYHILGWLDTIKPPSPSADMVPSDPHEFIKTIPASERSGAEFTLPPPEPKSFPCSSDSHRETLIDVGGDAGTKVSKLNEGYRIFLAALDKGLIPPAEYARDRIPKNADTDHAEIHNTHREKMGKKFHQPEGYQVYLAAMKNGLISPTSPTRADFPTLADSSHADGQTLPNNQLELCKKALEPNSDLDPGPKAEENKPPSATTSEINAFCERALRQEEKGSQSSLSSHSDEHISFVSFTDSHSPHALSRRASDGLFDLARMRELGLIAPEDRDRASISKNSDRVNADDPTTRAEESWLPASALAKDTPPPAPESHQKVSPTSPNDDEPAPEQLQDALPMSPNSPGKNPFRLGAVVRPHHDSAVLQHTTEPNPPAPQNRPSADIDKGDAPRTWTLVEGNHVYRITEPADSVNPRSQHLRPSNCDEAREILRMALKSRHREETSTTSSVQPNPHRLRLVNSEDGDKLLKQATALTGGPIRYINAADTADLDDFHVHKKQYWHILGLSRKPTRKIAFDFDSNDDVDIQTLDHEEEGAANPPNGPFKFQKPRRHHASPAEVAENWLRGNPFALTPSEASAETASSICTGDGEVVNAACEGPARRADLHVVDPNGYPQPQAAQIEGKFGYQGDIQVPIFPFPHLTTRCRALSCPVKGRHEKGPYLHDGKLRTRDGNIFGASNPPVEVWEAYDRIKDDDGSLGGKGKERVGAKDVKIVTNFARHHFGEAAEWSVGDTDAT